MDDKIIMNRSYGVFKSYYAFMHLYAYLCDDKGFVCKKSLYPLLEKYLFSMLISDPLYQNLNCLSFFINLYHFQTHDLLMPNTKPFEPNSRALRDKLVVALEHELCKPTDDYEKYYQFRANRLALELTLLKRYYPHIASENLTWVKYYRKAEYEGLSYLSIQAMALIEQAYDSFQKYDSNVNELNSNGLCESI